MTRVAILMPDPASPSPEGGWQAALARLQAALDAVDIQARPTPWSDHVDDVSGLRDFDCVLPLLAWGYHLQAARWLQACATWQAAGVPMANPAEVLAWNTDKRYLGRMAEQGVPIPPTAFTDALAAPLLEEMFRQTGAEELIVKPAVSAGAWHTLRLRRGQAVDATPAGCMLVQPYLPAIEQAGETSLLYFGGNFSHAVNKRPASGEFRVQSQYGGRYVQVTPDAQALAVAARVLATVDAPLLYARIDLVPDGDGGWLLMEAELIEPDFYLGVDPAHGMGFARALQQHIRATR